MEPVSKKRKLDSKKAKVTRIAETSSFPRHTRNYERISKIAKPTVGEIPTIITYDQAAQRPGLFVQYLERLAKPDSELVLTFIKTRLFPLLGSTIVEQESSFESIMQIWRNFHPTIAGLELTHMVFCLNIGLHCQARVNVVHQNNQYVGCVIEGDFTIRYRGQIYGPTTSVEQFKDVLGYVDTHSFSISKLNELLKTDISGVQSRRELHHFIMAPENVVSVNTLELIRQYAAGLNFQIRYWEQTPHNIRLALEWMSTDTPLEDDLPMHPSVIGNPDRVAQVLGLFGSYAPCFNITGSRSISLSVQMNPISPFQYHSMELSSSIASMHQIIQTGKILNGGVSRQSSKYTLRTVPSDLVPDVIGRLCSLCGIGQQTAEASTGNVFSQAKSGFSNFKW
jgi:hypothetical protein